MFSLGLQEVILILVVAALNVLILAGVVGGIMYLFERKRLLACAPRPTPV